MDVIGERGFAFPNLAPGGFSPFSFSHNPLELLVKPALRLFTEIALILGTTHHIISHGIPTPGNISIVGSGLDYRMGDHLISIEHVSQMGVGEVTTMTGKVSLIEHSGHRIAVTIFSSSITLKNGEQYKKVGATLLIGFFHHHIQFGLSYINQTEMLFECASHIRLWNGPLDGMALCLVFSLGAVVNEQFGLLNNIGGGLSVRNDFINSFM